jgi:hypothetical protein
MTSLQFLLTTESIDEVGQSGRPAVEFRPDPEKKSAFWVKDCHSASPAHGYIAGPGTFFLGGLQIISNSRTVEIHLKQNNNNQQETYLTTCRGVPSEGNYKIVCAIPGGPRQVHQAHLKFVTNEPELIITSLRVTARIPEIIQSSVEKPCAEPANSLPDRNPLPSSPSLPATQSTDNTSDWNTSIAGLAFLVRNTSEKHWQQIQSLHQQQQAMELRLWQPLCAQMASQSSLVSQQNEQIQQQTRILQQQQEQIQALTRQLQELTNLVQRQPVATIDTSSTIPVGGKESDDDSNDNIERAEEEEEDGYQLQNADPLTTRIDTEEQGIQEGLNAATT